MKMQIQLKAESELGMPLEGTLLENNCVGTPATATVAQEVRAHFGLSEELGSVIHIVLVLHK